MEDDLRASILKAGYNVSLLSIDVHETRKLRRSVTWRSNKKPDDTLPLVRELMRLPGVSAVMWSPQDADEHTSHRRGYKNVHRFAALGRRDSR